MSKTKDQKVEAFLLRDCVFGNAGDVVKLSAADAEAGKAQGSIDTHPSAIKASKVK